MTQKERLLNYLKLRTKINPLESWQNLGIYRLSAVVLDLRKDGHQITTERTPIINQFGEECHVATYVFTPPLQPIVRGDPYLDKAIKVIRETRELLRSENDKYELS